MLLHFHINYATHFGQELFLSGSAPEAGNFKEEQAVEMNYTGGGNWYLSFEVSDTGIFEYRYLVLENGKIQRREWGNNHSFLLRKNISSYILYDSWQQETRVPFLYTSAFTDSYLAIEEKDTSKLYKPGHIVLKVFAPFVRKGQDLMISGDIPLLGDWDLKKALHLFPGKFPEWNISFKISDLPELCNYKFVITDRNSEDFSSWESGTPRNLTISKDSKRNLIIYSGALFRYQGIPWKASGVAIPVFSLRSKKSWGCGDFGDLKKMIDWTVLTGQQMIQLLPVNDTSITGTWKDSYPYNAVSIFALHPAYLSISQLHTLKDAKSMDVFEKERRELNDLPEIDYEKVMQLKTNYIQKLFKQEGKKTLQTKGFKAFFEKNKDWLVPYAVFSYLRISLNDFNFRNWGKYAVYNVEKINDFSKPEHPWYNEISIYYFTQYLLHVQLTESRNYAHQHSVVLKGDIPIGISRFSVEAWTEPHLFNLDSQIGAPPDDFSEKGQNWGFPAYNWKKMAEEDYHWWKRRFCKMADYFDAYRIDHILGFFRIWEIPANSVEGMLGYFQPALPYNLQEIKDFGFCFEESMTEPFITDSVLDSIFHEKADEIRNKYLKMIKGGRYRLKAKFNTQQKIKDQFSEDLSETEKSIMDGLFQLCNEVLFIRDPQYPELLHPRISGHKTFKFQTLDEYQKSCFVNLHNQFFYKRNVAFWRQKALEKLPHILNATHMLVCGEDLGMIPSCVPEVMHQLNILSLEIQRMPKRIGINFENLNYIPYLSVCTTSTHDMSPIRAWWLENREKTQQYYQEILWKNEEAPKDCTPETANLIVQNHLNSPAMLVILPWQDWMSIDGKLRRKDPEEERINIPANPRYYWKYRMHLTLEQLLEEKELNDNILRMNKSAGRC
jgi:4-alpha-glucanotransferase